jgi:hypothetical protein
MKCFVGNLAVKGIFAGVLVHRKRDSQVPGVPDYLLAYLTRPQVSAQIILGFSLPEIPYLV